MNKEINYNYKLPPFKWFCLTNFPFIEADFDALTYYELLCKVVQYLNEVIVKTNAIGEQTEELTNAFNTLKDYVDNYFDNLDVQEEINNKLDEMAENGKLEEIISQYLNSTAIFGFDNVASMKSATNLIDGSYAKTLGYYTKNDGGSATYKIRNVTNEDVVDNMLLIQMNNQNLVAELINENDFIEVEKLGAKGDGVSDDTDFIKKAVANFNKIILSKTYLIDETITLNSNQEITGNGTLKTNEDIEIFNALNVHNLTIKDLKLNKKSGYNYHIQFSGYFIEVNNCEMMGSNFDSSNFVNGIFNSAVTEDMGSYCNKIINNTIRNGQVVVNSTDGFLKNNIIWSSTSATAPDAYAVKIMNDSWDIEGNQIVGGSLGGLYYKGKSVGNLINITNNYFDGSYSSIHTGTHITLEDAGNSVNITNNKFYNGYKNSITLIRSYYVMINNNTFFNNNRYSSGLAEIEIGEYTYGNRISICNNMFQNLSNPSFDLIHLTGKGNILFKDNIIHGTINTEKNYVNKQWFNSVGNMVNGITYQRVTGMVQSLSSDRYGVMFNPELYKCSMAINELQISDVDNNTYSVARVNNQYIIYKVSNVDNGKPLTAIVSLAIA